MKSLMTKRSFYNYTISRVDSNYSSHVNKVIIKLNSYAGLTISMKVTGNSNSSLTIFPSALIPPRSVA